MMFIPINLPVMREFIMQSLCPNSSTPLPIPKLFLICEFLTKFMAHVTAVKNIILKKNLIFRLGDRCFITMFF